MAKVINLRQARKVAARAAKRRESEAVTDAARFSASDKAGVARAKADTARLEGHKREDD